MSTNDLTPNELLPRPHPDNTVAEEFARIIALANALDTKITELRSLIAGKAAASHTHTIANISGLQGALDSKQLLSWRPTLDDLNGVSVSGAALGQVLRYDGTNWIPNTLSVAWGDISGKPSSFSSAWADVTGKPLAFPPSAHSHAIPDITNLQTTLNGKLDLSGGTISGNLTVSQALTVASRPVFGAQAVEADGGNEADLELTEEIRLSQNFVATGSRALFVAKTYVEHSAGGDNTVAMVLEIYDTVVNAIAVADSAVGATVSGKNNPCLTAICAIGNLTVGRTYTARIKLRKLASTGPIYPREMRIGGFVG